MFVILKRARSCLRKTMMMMTTMPVEKRFSWFGWFFSCVARKTNNKKTLSDRVVFFFSPAQEEMFNKLPQRTMSISRDNKLPIYSPLKQSSLNKPSWQISRRVQVREEVSARLKWKRPWKTFASVLFVKTLSTRLERRRQRTRRTRDEGTRNKLLPTFHSISSSDEHYFRSLEEN